MPLLSRSAVAVDAAVAGDEAHVPRGAEVAIIPPVSGG
jgi:molybdopterin converting factor small subunit